MPPVLPGNYFIVVEVDSRGLVPDANRATTVLATTSPALVTAPSLTIGGMAATGTAVLGQPVVYAIADSTGADFNLELTSGASGTMSLLAGYQSVPDFKQCRSRCRAQLQHADAGDLGSVPHPRRPGRHRLRRPHLARTGPQRQLQPLRLGGGSSGQPTLPGLGPGLEQRDAVDRRHGIHPPRV